jgi:hypothetical protein
VPPAILAILEITLGLNKRLLLLERDLESALEELLAELDCPSLADLERHPPTSRTRRAFALAARLDEAHAIQGDYNQFLEDLGTRPAQKRAASFGDYVAAYERVRDDDAEPAAGRSTPAGPASATAMPGIRGRAASALPMAAEGELPCRPAFRTRPAPGKRHVRPGVDARARPATTARPSPAPSSPAPASPAQPNWSFVLAPVLPGETASRASPAAPLEREGSAPVPVPTRADLERALRETLPGADGDGAPPSSSLPNGRDPMASALVIATRIAEANGCRITPVQLTSDLWQVSLDLLLDGDLPAAWLDPVAQAAARDRLSAVARRTGQRVLDHLAGAAEGSLSTPVHPAALPAPALRRSEPPTASPALPGLLQAPYVEAALARLHGGLTAYARETLARDGLDIARAALETGFENALADRVMGLLADWRRVLDRVTRDTLPPVAHKG